MSFRWNEKGIPETMGRFEITNTIIPELPDKGKLYVSSCINAKIRKTLSNEYLLSVIT